MRLVTRRKPLSHQRISNNNLIRSKSFFGFHKGWTCSEIRRLDNVRIEMVSDVRPPYTVSLSFKVKLFGSDVMQNKEKKVESVRKDHRYASK